ncbi:MAG TPA: N-acetyltransferase [Candidatus Eisenbacteria bacterium]
MPPPELTVHPVAPGRDFRRFALLPWDIYAGDPYWVPPLLIDFNKLFDTAKHPFHRHSEAQPFLAVRGGKPVGRITAIWNRNHQKFHGEDAGFFGFFECVDDADVAAALLEVAAAWLKERGLTVMRGPANFSSNEEWGLLVDGWNGTPKVMMPYNPRWYPALFDKAGLRTAKDLVAYFLPHNQIPERVARGTALVRRRSPDVTIRSINMKKFEAEVGIIRDIYNASWEKNWGFVPMTDPEIEHMARELKPVVDPDLVFFAEKAGEVIGFSLSLPDVYPALQKANGRLLPFGIVKLLWYARQAEWVRVLTLGLLPEHRKSGVDVMMYDHLFKVCQRKGYRGGEFSWLLEDNLAIRTAMDNLGGYVYRTYRLYEKEIA